MSSNSVFVYIVTANGFGHFRDIYASVTAWYSRVPEFHLHWGPLINCVNSYTKLNLGCLGKFKLHKTPS